MKYLIYIFLLLVTYYSIGKEFHDGLDKREPLQSNGARPVNIQTLTARAFDVRAFSVTKIGMSLAETPVVDSYILVYNSGHGLATNENLGIIEESEGEIFSVFGSIQDVSTNIITLDNPIPFEFTTNILTSFVSTENMAVDGSATNQIFSLFNSTSYIGHLNRIIFHITDGTIMDDAKFGGISALTRGLSLRKKLLSGYYINYGSPIKNNGEFGELAFDKVYDDKAPAGVYGLTVRLTYSGADKHGVAIELLPGESFEILVQDDLTDLTSFSVMFQGSFLNGLRTNQ